MKNVELMREYMRLVEAGEKEPWKHFERYLPIPEEWVTMRSCSWFTDCDTEFRSKPKTININGFKVPEPVRRPLDKGVRYYIPMLFGRFGYSPTVWDGDEFDIKTLKMGIMHLTKEAAIAHTKALLSFTAKG